MLARTSTDEFHADDTACVHAALQLGERIVWTGRPSFRWLTLRLVVAWILAALVLGLLWPMGNGVARRIANERATSGVSAGTWLCVIPGGILLGLFGIALFAAPLVNRRSLRRTIYVVTDRAAIVLCHGEPAARYEPEKLLAMRCVVRRRDGWGDLVMDVTASVSSTGTSSDFEHGFLAMENVREVEDVIVRTLLKGRTRAVPVE